MRTQQRQGQGPLLRCIVGCVFACASLMLRLWIAGGGGFMSLGMWLKSCLMDDLLEVDPDHHGCGGGTTDILENDHQDGEGHQHGDDHAMIMPSTDEHISFNDENALYAELTANLNKDANDKDKKTFASINFVEDEKNGSFTIANHEQEQIWTQAMHHLFSFVPEQEEFLQQHHEMMVAFASTNENNNNNNTWIGKNDIISSSQYFLDAEITWMERIPQQEAWDCGVACLQMLLQWIRKSNNNDRRMTAVDPEHLGKDDDDVYKTEGKTSPKQLPNLEWFKTTCPTSNDSNEEDMTKVYLRQERENLLRELQTQSIWTVDIVYLLENLVQPFNQAANEKDMQINVLFCSTLLEMNQTYGDFAYYQHSFDKDQARIRGLFQTLLHQSNNSNSNSNNRAATPIALQTNKIPLSQLVWMVNQPQSVAMVLVDNSILVRGTNTNNNSQNQYPPPPSSLSWQKSASQSYAGHYILLVGTSRDPNHLRQSCHLCEEEEEDNAEKDKCHDHHHQQQQKDEQQQHEVKHFDYCFVAYNPGNHTCMDENGVMFLAPQLLEKAWRATGTDEDVIFVVQKRK
ncbi:hypothetical protein ACA910_015062 [Epithemia clementina (nom. ined.)]